MKTALRVLTLLQLFSVPSCADSLYFNSRLDLPVYTQSLRPQHPTKFDKSYIGSPRSYAAEPKEIVIAGKTLTTGLAAAGAFGASDPLSAAGFLLIGLFSVRDLSRAVKQPRQPPSGWFFIWSRAKR